MIDLKLGGSIQMSYIEDGSDKELDIFIGRIFFAKGLLTVIPLNLPPMMTVYF